MVHSVYSCSYTFYLPSYTAFSITVLGATSVPSNVVWILNSCKCCLQLWEMITKVLFNVSPWVSQIGIHSNILYLKVVNYCWGIKAQFIYSCNTKSWVLLSVCQICWTKQRAVFSCSHVLSTQKLKTYPPETDVTWCEYVIWWTVEAMTFWWHLTLTFDLPAIFVLSDKKIAL